METAHDHPGGVSRRDFLITGLGLTGALAAAGLAAPIVRYVTPTAQPEVAPSIRVAVTADLTPLDKVVDFEYQEIPSTLLQLRDGSYVGLSRVCTHLGCIIKWQPKDTTFFCPCHAGVFSPTGEVLGGPPPRPLPTLKIEQRGDEIWAVGWNPS